MGNKLFYAAMACGLAGAFIILVCPCGVLMCIIDRVDKRRERREAAARALRQAHINLLMSLGQSEAEAMIAVDFMSAECPLPNLPANPPNTPCVSRVPTPEIPEPIPRPRSPGHPPPPPENTPASSPVRSSHLGQTRQRSYVLEQGLQYQVEIELERRDRERRREERRRERERERRHVGRGRQEDNEAAEKWV